MEDKEPLTIEEKLLREHLRKILKDKTPEELEAESLRLHLVRQEMSKERIKAVEEMSKHPLSLEQMREQIRQHHEEAKEIDADEKNIRLH